MRFFLAPAGRMGERAFLAVLPHGGQRRSRTNAWQAMVADRRRVADRAAADRAFAAARAQTAAETQVTAAQAAVGDERRPRALAGAD